MKHWISGNKGFVLFLFGMLFVRSAMADWYVIPSGSMYPTLLVGDRVISNRLAYDVKIPFTDVIVKHIADPQRGDIVTFTSPKDGVRLVKRLVAVPGDIVEMRNEHLIINGVEANYQADSSMNVPLTPGYHGEQIALYEEFSQRRHAIMLMPERAAYRDFAPVKVPEGQYLMLGDSRDNSADSRYIGFVKRELLTGRVEHVAYSLDSERYHMPRLDRFLKTAE